jgi:nitroimidazol reductase NimA-like FMN-containing flavoprotein (pyridoxamine 5'-phosphate oxidase superfamily)
MTPIATPLTRDQCVARLSGRTVGRVSVSRGALPVVVPVVYELDGDSVLFHAPLDGLLAAACDGAVIAFEVDDLATAGCPAGGWSVHVTGVGSLVTDEVVRLETDRITGQERQVTPVIPVMRAGTAV